MKHPRIDTLVGRTDDMFKVKGVNMFPTQVEEVICRDLGYVFRVPGNDRAYHGPRRAYGAVRNIA